MKTSIPSDKLHQVMKYSFLFKLYLKVVYFFFIFLLDRKYAFGISTNKEKGYSV